MYVSVVKRALDLLVASVALLAVSPIVLIVILFLWLANAGEVFFFQQRPGKNGEAFTIYKFKTMNDRVDASGALLSDEQRLTLPGRIIRKTSLDELLQLVNVIKGDMSLIGPRPLLTRYLPLYNEHQLRRHEVRPGITGLAQVKGRNTLDWHRRFRYDVFYVDHLSFALDLLILWWTLQQVVCGSGVEFSEDVSWEFTGTKKSDLQHRSD
jgi:lipopolysaccharide/colanic/teichoic acid biosynthesis glycosyltransferase